MSAPTLAQVQELATRCAAGDAEALRDYPDAAKRLLDNIKQTLESWLSDEEEYERARGEVIGQIDHLLDTSKPAPAGPSHCPFCGGGAQLHPGDILAERQEPDSFWVSCRVCRAESDVFGTSEEAIAAWNRRHPSDALRGGEVTLNEARAMRGLPPLPDPRGEWENMPPRRVTSAEIVVPGIFNHAVRIEDGDEKPHTDGARLVVYEGDMAPEGDTPC